MSTLDMTKCSRMELGNEEAITHDRKDFEKQRDAMRQHCNESRHRQKISLDERQELEDVLTYADERESSR